MRGYSKCHSHFMKIVFPREEDANIYMKTFFACISYEVYPCPTGTHYHVRNKTKRNKKRKEARRSQENSGG